MKYFSLIIGLLALLGLCLVGTMGVDLNNTRAGFGCLVLGSAGIALGSRFLFGGRRDAPYALILVSTMSAVYFLTRAVHSESLSLGVADAMLVIVAFGGYFLALGGRLIIRCLVGGLALLCLANAIYGIFQLRADEQIYLWRSGGGGVPVFTGLFGHYNYLSGFLNGGCFFFLSVTLIVRANLYKLLAGSVFVISVASVFASGTRGGLVGLVAGFAVWMFLVILWLKQKGSRSLGPVVLAGLIVVVTALILLVPTLQNISNDRSVRSLGDLAEDTRVLVADGGRFGFQQMAFEMFQDSPVFGNGARAFSYLAWSHWDPEERPVWDHNPQFAHNEFLQTLSDYGAVGFALLFLVILSHAFSGLIKIMDPIPANGHFLELSMMQIGAMAGMGAILTQSYFSFLIHVPSIALLLGIQLGILGCGRRKEVRRLALAQPLVGLSALACFGIMVLGGWELSSSFLMHQSAVDQLSSDTSPEERRGLMNRLSEAAALSLDAEGHENAGQLAMVYAASYVDSGSLGDAYKMRRFAVGEFEKALVLNPFASRALVGHPSVNDALGNFREADEGHRRSMKVLAIREFHLKPHLHAAKSSFVQGVMASREGNLDDSYRKLTEGRFRMDKRDRIFPGIDRRGEGKELNERIEKWILFTEAEMLYREGDRVWKEARPREPELAMGLMLAAQERYLASGKEVLGLAPRWRPQYDQLKENLDLLKAARVQPREITPEMIEEVIKSEAGLDPSAATR